MTPSGVIIGLVQYSRGCGLCLYRTRTPLLFTTVMIYDYKYQVEDSYRGLCIESWSWVFASEMLLLQRHPSYDLILYDQDKIIMTVPLKNR
jgi:hypothetical protein